MVGFGLRKYAKELGLSVSGGVAYGLYRGYALTFSEGMCYKYLAITTAFPAGRDEELFTACLNQFNLNDYRILDMTYTDYSMDIICA